MGSVIGAAFATDVSDASFMSATGAAPSGSPSRPHLSSTGSDTEAAPKNEPRVVDFGATNGAAGSGGDEKDVKKVHSAAENAFHTLTHGISCSPQPEEQHEGKTEGNTAREVKVVELPPTHIQSP